MPFVFAANGRSYLKQIETESGIWFRDTRRSANHRRALVGWPTPEGLSGQLEINQDTAATALQQMPFEFGFPLRDYQQAAIKAVENALAAERRSMLLAMATGKRLLEDKPDELSKWLSSRAGIGPILDWQGDSDITPRFMPISHHPDEVIDVSRGYGAAKKPEDFLDGFRDYVRANVNTMAALKLVVQRPRDLTGLIIEVFYCDPFLAKSFDAPNPGWFWWTCRHGCLPQVPPRGPFGTSYRAYCDAMVRGGKLIQFGKGTRKSL